MRVMLLNFLQDPGWPLQQRVTQPSMSTCQQVNRDPASANGLLSLISCLHHSVNDFKTLHGSSLNGLKLNYLGTSSGGGW